MSRKREQSLLDDVFDTLKVMPIWVGPIMAAVAFVAIRYGVPLLIPQKTGGVDPGVVLRPMVPFFAWLITAIILVGWLMAEVHKLWSRRLLDKQSGIDSIRSISWSHFEHLVCEAYRRKGYLAEVVGSPSGDGGVDILLTARGQKVLVQCKQWKAFKVGVKPVRELLGVMVSQKATGGILVTSGRFTGEAVQFATANPTLKLVNGEQLAGLIQAVQNGSAMERPKEVGSAKASSPQCPSCNVAMVLRTARSGTNAGSQFWGCPNFPKCRQTQNI